MTLPSGTRLGPYAILAPLGYRVLRFTDRQVEKRPYEVIAALRAVLG